MIKMFISLLFCAAVLLTGCTSASSDPVGESNPPARSRRTSEPASDPEPTSIPVSATSIGDIIEFGRYTWRVLDIRDKMALILIENLIEDKTYHNEWIDVTWETSDIRSWLNDEFYKSFSAAERARIQETAVINNDNPWTNSSGGNDTSDKIFLLTALSTPMVLV